MRTTYSIGIAVVGATLLSAAQAGAQADAQLIGSMMQELGGVGPEARAPILRRFADRALYITEPRVIELAKEELSSMWLEGAHHAPAGGTPTLIRYELLRALARIALADQLSREADPVWAATEILEEAFQDYLRDSTDRERAAAAIRRITPRHANHVLRRMELDQLMGGWINESESFAVAAAVEWLGRHAKLHDEWVKAFAEILDETPAGPLKLHVIEHNRGAVLWADETRFALAAALRGTDFDSLAVQHLLYARDPQVGIMAIHQFASLKGLEERKMWHFRRLLRSDEGAIVREAVTAIATLGPAAEWAIPEIERLTAHEDRQIAARAKASLRQIRR